MDFVFAVVFQFLYFIRPQDWIPGLAGARLVALNTVGLLCATAIRPDGLKLKDLVRTPIEVGMLIYLGYVIYTANDQWQMFRTLRPYYFFFILTILALPTVARVERYLMWWMRALVSLASIGFLTAIGIDLTGADELIAQMDGRLCINTWMQNNPNALGHTCAVAVALIYFWYFWKRNTEKRIIGAVLMFIVLYCVYSTQSKGSYIVSGLTLLSSLLFGRSKIFKVVAVGLALGLGGTALSQLPRMQTLTRKEEGVQGRLMAWEMARVAMYNNPHGVGWDKFVAVFLWEGEYVTKATHSSYVQIGAALGKPGLFLYMGLLWCGFRAIMFTKVRSDQELRVQGMLYAIFVPFCLSNWMIDRAYHTEFFTMLAAIAAFHRAVGLRIPSKLEAETQPASKVPVGSPSPQPDFVLSPVTDPSLQVALAHAASSNITLQANQPIAWNRGGPMVFPEPVNAEEQRAAQIQQDVKKAWRRIGLIDIGMAYLLYLGVIEAWEYIIKNF